MPNWTLRQQRTRQMFEGESQEHTAARRAQRYVRRHAWQTGPLVRETAVVNGKTPVTLVSRFARGIFEGFASTRLVPLGTTPSIPPCPSCGRRVGHEPGCGTGAGVRLTPAECETCSHPHVSGVRCTHSYSPGGALFCGCTG